MGWLSHFRGLNVNGQVLWRRGILGGLGRCLIDEFDGTYGLLIRVHER